MSQKQIHDVKSTPKNDVSNARTVAVNLQKTQRVNGDVRLIHGANSRSYSIAGMSVQDVRKKFRNILNIPKDVEVRVNGENVSDDFVLETGMIVEFSKTAGSKGQTKYESLDCKLSCCCSLRW